MALSQQVKDALDGMNHVDQALVILYIQGVDDNALAGTIGEQFIRAYYPDIDPGTATNTQKAKALLRQVGNHIKGVYVGTKATTAGVDAQDTARTDADDDFAFTEIDPTT